MTEIIKHIVSPDPEIIRRRESARAKSGEVNTKGCPHPVSAIEWIVDDDGTSGRYARPTNLFVCGVCNNFLRLVDFNGAEAKDA